MKQNKNIGHVIFMAVVAAIGGILFGYDTAVISGTTEIVRNQFSLTASGEGYDKAITFEFPHFMSPQSVYGAAGNLYNRYKEYFNIK